jgi:hypothetical protein
MSKKTKKPLKSIILLTKEVQYLVCRREGHYSWCQICKEASDSFWEIPDGGP